MTQTGIVELIGRQINRIAGKSPRGLVLLLCVTIASLSAFVVNTATVAIFIPIAIVLAKERGGRVDRCSNHGPDRLFEPRTGI